MRVEVTENTINKELTALKAAAPAVVFEFVSSTTREIHSTAVRGIQRGPTSGRFYQKYRPRRAHQASAPGEYPQSDTGRLASSIQFELPANKTKPTGFVGTNLMYGKYLEFKPVTRGGRPWLSRAFKTVIRRGTDRILARIMKRRGKL